MDLQFFSSECCYEIFLTDLLYCKPSRIRLYFDSPILYLLLQPFICESPLQVIPVGTSQLLQEMSYNTTNGNHSDHWHFIDDYHPILIACSVLICITNCLVITLFVSQASLRSTGNYLLFSLAISDLAVGVIGIPMNFLCEMLLNWKACLSSFTVNRFIATSTVYHILWITLEKYSAIIHPLRHKSQFDHKKVKYICLYTWLGSVLLSVVQLSWLSQHDNPNAHYPDDIQRKETIYNIFTFAGVFVFPMTVMIFAYASIFLRILKQHSNKTLRKHVRSSQTSVSRNMKTAILFFLILLVFILGWFWWFFMIIYCSILECDGKVVSVPVAKLFAVLRYSTAFINPILYTFFKRDFNKALRKLVNRRRHGQVEKQQTKFVAVVSHLELSSLQNSERALRRNAIEPDGWTSRTNVATVCRAAKIH